MKTRIIYKSFLAFLLLGSIGCSIPILKTPTITNSSIPSIYTRSTDSIGITKIIWKDYFSDSNLSNLINTALKNNQELNIITQEIEISKNEVMARTGEYAPFVGVLSGAEYEKIGKYTWRGGVEENIDIKENPKAIHSNFGFLLGATSSWEIDAWRKLHTLKDAAYTKYLSSVEGKNFMITTLIAEIANSYYELTALDRLLEIIQQNIVIQSDALRVVHMQKDAAKVSQLAVNRFEAQLLNTENLQFEIKQKIIETENRINYLCGRFPAPLQRSTLDFYNLSVDSVKTGIPSLLLANRPDIRQAEKELVAAKLNVRAARANFYPSVRITARSGFQSFNPLHVVNPAALIYNLAGDLMAPLINKKAITATYANANATQIQAMYKYEQTILNAYVNVMNELAKIENYSQSYNSKLKQVNILIQSITIANNLFNSARADYNEVLLTQREVLESKMELIEIKMKQINAKINIYKALGGGWN